MCTHIVPTRLACSPRVMAGMAVATVLRSTRRMNRAMSSALRAPQALLVVTTSPLTSHGLDPGAELCSWVEDSCWAQVMAM